MTSNSSQKQQPWLMINDRKKCCILQNNVFDNRPPLLYDVGGEIPEFLGRYIACSFGEWVLLMGTRTGDSLVNLLSKESIEVPSLNFNYSFCVLTSHPYDPTCHIVYYDRAENALIFCQPGDKEFTIRKWDYEFSPIPKLAVVHGKILIAIGEPRDLVMGVIEFKDCTYRVEVMQMDQEIRPRYLTYSYFFEYSGELFKVYKILSGGFSSNVTGFEIFKADLVRKRWVSVKNIGRVAIFIGLKAGQVKCASVDESAAASSIYFLELDDLDSYYIYSLVEGTIRMKPTFFSSMDMETIKSKHMQFDWIMMHCDASFPKLLQGDQESSGKENKEVEEEEVGVQNSWNTVLRELLNLFQLHLFGRDNVVFRVVCKLWQQVSFRDNSIPSISSLLSSFPKLLQDSEKENKASGEVEEEEVGVQNSWNTVPPELLNLIQLHLFGRDHAVFRVVCKAWQQVSIQYYSIPSITLLELCQSFSPLLMFQEDITISDDDSVPIFRFFDPVHRKSYRTGIPELREAKIHYSRDGWLLVSRRSDRSVFFINPLTQEKIELPTNPHYHRYGCPDSFSFSSPPTCSNCLIVGMDKFGRFMFTLKHGEETWKLDRFDQGQTECRRIYAYRPVVLNGLHHFMCENRDMLVFNLKDRVEGQSPYCQTRLTKFKRLDDLRVEDFFLEIDGALALVSVEMAMKKISIFKWNDLETDWELMEGGVEFGGKEMFLSRRDSFLEKIDDVGGMGNTIFLPMVDDAKEGVFYSLATHRYHTFYNGYSSELPYNVDKFLNGVWVKPERKIVGDNNLKWFV